MCEVLLFCLLAAVPALAQPPHLVVRDDRGGPLEARLARIESLRQQGRAVAIPEGRCLSACTLYLGLEETCVGKAAIFGFHGPTSQFGTIALPRAEFERLSNMMARSYPESLRVWFLLYARYQTLTYHYVKGEELIRLGVAECPDAID
ncbi:hypothetical protein LZA78_01545 [Sinirhodobacter sp. WL0062]|uniref:Uncharacterized protein n=1 Tax=Rhodobacter flavimaris TaxID=2907145 RepID=A0ABS8YQJ9_9RHOB|nr:hypothetical protein [Sinirhodobacter sp. WL0062]MCE5972174.1 hypothetical protein [Sinirhodobacter sp. WL0062]